jgi:hypothetical protein
MASENQIGLDAHSDGTKRVAKKKKMKKLASVKTHREEESRR